jgi:hypothetical protein
VAALKFDWVKDKLSFTHSFDMNDTYRLVPGTGRTLVTTGPTANERINLRLLNAKQALKGRCG